MSTPDKAIGVRSTRQRSAISALLDESKGFRSAQDLHAELRDRGDAIGLTTVYRTLQSMSDAGAVDVLRTDSGELIFRKCSDSHHHHLVCRVCGFTVEVEEPGVETWAHRAGGAHGFTEVTHTVELFGLCEACVAARRDGSAGIAD
ncbi:MULTISPECIES: Fur family transcriptional regulator [Dietzia]|uniref:Transcriptional repressor n=1 Tax=Dietzia psychralcaliphila TaxID=139021 RepID=A0AAD0NME1_9ACTN|nr:Fur family transcriptional regulator [Dietzia psychralcaliphila]AWH95080.1 transcriptional repressor [Dietzia psychralcaliphila]MBB1049867.1 transcriptional repressor [Dietzia sp. CW19]PTM87298.1 Fur family zinc uptake regulator [Dietzia psychralcaliphila]